MAQNPAKRSQGWGALFCLKERPGPSKGSLHTKQTTGAFCRDLGGWGQPWGGGELPGIKSSGSCLLCPFLSRRPPSSSSKAHVSNPGPSPSASQPLPISSRGIRCMWNSLGGSRAHNPPRLDMGRALSTAPKWRAGWGRPARVRLLSPLCSLLCSTRLIAPPPRGQAGQPSPLGSGTPCEKQTSDCYSQRRLWGSERLLI